MRRSPTPASTLPAESFRRYDETPDEVFYEIPRLVTHIDEAAIEAVTQLYREFFPPGGVILDLMSSWVSHLPPEAVYERVVGLGMNAEELAANPQLDEALVQNLNVLARLPFADNTFDGCGICVSIDYLTNPVAVLAEVRRVLKPNAPVVITFSNRCFPTKAVALWHALDDNGHLQVVAHFLRDAGGWEDTKLLDRSPRGALRGDPLFAVTARKGTSDAAYLYRK